MTARSIKAIHETVRDDIGDLVTRRPLPGKTVAQIDPFLFLNHHGPQTYPPNNKGLPFGPHPHRGFETVTFILEGELGHYDSGGHESVIRAGGVQWMTAGAGLIHAELSPKSFKEKGGPLEILQLWVNLPSRLKMAKPAYVGLQREHIPAMTIAPGAVISVIAGSFGGVPGRIRSLCDHFMSTLDLKRGAHVAVPAPAPRNVFFYIVRGGLRINGQDIGQWRLVEFNNDGETIGIETAEDALVVFGHGAPLNEPVVAQGPFVMNTREEIVQAIEDFQAGKFGEPPPVSG
jgi:quercetin 2,3-dioxygenase